LCKGAIGARDLSDGVGDVCFRSEQIACQKPPSALYPFRAVHQKVPDHPSPATIRNLAFNVLHPLLQLTLFAHPPELAPIMAQALNTIYKWAVPAAIALSFAQASIYDVKGGTRAVIFDRLAGVKEDVINEGTHFLVPWLQKSIIYDVRTRPRNISTTTGSKDMQMVSLTLRVLHRPEVKMLPKIYQVRLSHLTSCIEKLS
jgi:hypothetical protein